MTLAVEDGDAVTASYAWRAQPARVAGRMIATVDGDRIARLVVTFD